MRVKNPGPGPVSLADGRVLGVGEVGTIDEVGDEDKATLDRGGLIESVDDGIDLDRASSEDIAAWVESHKVADVLAAAGDDPDRAARLLAAENSLSSPRRGVLEGLTPNQEEGD